MTLPVELRQRAHRPTVARVQAISAEKALFATFTMAMLVTLRLCGWITVAGVAIAGLYLVKSALGIDILPGPSPLHDLLFPLIRR